jgi:predicted nucleic acid-binding protein
LPDKTFFDLQNKEISLEKGLENTNIDLSIFIRWGTICGEYEKAGMKLPVIDSLLVATCLVYKMTFITRNVGDIKIKECIYLNPWE